MLRFAVRSLYRWNSDLNDTAAATEYPYLYEERIVLIEARSDKEALETGFQEAETYAAKAKAMFLRRVDAFKYDEGDTEIFSSLRSSRLDPVEFQTEFYRDHDNHRRMSNQQSKG